MRRFESGPGGNDGHGEQTELIRANFSTSSYKRTALSNAGVKSKAGNLRAHIEISFVFEMRNWLLKPSFERLPKWPICGQKIIARYVYAMVRNGKKQENLNLSPVAATFEKAIEAGDAVDAEWISLSKFVSIASTGPSDTFLCAKLCATF